MLRIRGEQMKTFEQANIRRFEQELVDHLKSFSPGHAKVLGDEGLLKVVRFGTERAARYLFTNAGPIRLYVELIFLLGGDFDTDPQIPWAGAILRETANTNQTLAADRLYEETMRYLQATSGPDNQWAKDSLRLARAEPFEGLALSEGGWVSEGLARLKRIYPQKFDHVGEAALTELMRRGRQYCVELGINTGAGAAYVVAMMYAAGHKFYADPHLPWIESTLARTSDEPNRRVERAYAKTMRYLDSVLANMKQG